MQSLAGTPDVGTTDAVKDSVYAPAREVVNFFHEVLMPVINWDTAHVENGRRPSSMNRYLYISNSTRRPSCNSAEPTPPAAP